MQPVRASDSSRSVIIVDFMWVSIRGSTGLRDIEHAHCMGRRPKIIDAIVWADHDRSRARPDHLTGRAMGPAVNCDRVQRKIVVQSSRAIAAYGIGHNAATGSEITYWTFAALW
jgi:hypothetical protein